MAAITYTTQLLNGILMLTMLFQNISRGIASWKRVKVILQTTPDIQDGVGDKETSTKGSIAFKQVSFAYPGSQQKVLNHIDLTIRPGETIAIMGATGCGKSSFVNLIPRFYDVIEGAVYVDGINVKDYKQQQLRQKVAIVSQKSELFSMTIKENIVLGQENVSEEDIKKAAIIAQASEFIDTLPNKENTMVAKRGMSLSGGQRQRIALARGILKDSEILILDDATSALDLKTEATFYEALKKSRSHTTKIIISGRIASIRHANRIVVLEEGNIIACGNHKTLLETCKTYQDIYASQMGRVKTL